MDLARLKKIAPLKTVVFLKVTKYKKFGSFFRNNFKKRAFSLHYQQLSVIFLCFLIDVCLFQHNFTKNGHFHFLARFGGHNMSHVVTKNVNFLVFHFFLIFNTPGTAKFHFLASCDHFRSPKVKWGVNSILFQFSDPE